MEESTSECYQKLEGAQWVLQERGIGQGGAGAVAAAMEAVAAGVGEEGPHGATVAQSPNWWRARAQ